MVQDNKKETRREISILEVLFMTLVVLFATVAILSVGSFIIMKETPAIPTISYTIMPTEGSKPYLETFSYNANATTSGRDFSHSFNLGNMSLSGGVSEYIEFEVPLGHPENSSEHKLCLSWVNLNVTVNGISVYSHDVNVNKTVEYSGQREAYIGFNFTLNNNTYGDTVFTLTDNFFIYSSGYVVDGIFGSITNYTGLYFNESVQHPNSIDIGLPWQYDYKTVNITNLLFEYQKANMCDMFSSKMVNFSLVWNSTAPIYLTYNGTTEQGYNGTFARIIPHLNLGEGINMFSAMNISPTSVRSILPISGFEFPNGYKVTFRLADVHTVNEVI